MALVVAGCQFSNPMVTQATKMACIDYIINCAIKDDKDVEQKVAEKCISEFQSGKRYELKY